MPQTFKYATELGYVKTTAEGRISQTHEEGKGGEGVCTISNMEYLTSDWDGNCDAVNKAYVINCYAPLNHLYFFLLK